MTPTQATKQWLEAKADYDAAKARLEPAAEVLKEYFRENDKRTFKGVSYASSTFRALDHGLLAQEVDADVLERCRVQRTRETLSPVA